MPDAPFQPALPTKRQLRSLVGGFAASGAMRPSDLADKLFKRAIPGPWLCCYMLRRFGWPNIGSDDYKELCSWTLTTPYPGLYLGVTPYLGGSNLHFSVRYNAAARKPLYADDPGREAYFARRDAATLKWWLSQGCKEYVLAYSKGDEGEVLVHEISAYEDGTKYGLWQRTADIPHGKFISLPRRKSTRAMILWHMGEFRRKQGHKVPKMNRREIAARVSPEVKEMQAAITTTLRGLLHPTNVRDILFTPFGDVERDPKAAKLSTGLERVQYFEHAGNTPEWLYTQKPKSKRNPKA